MGNPRLIVKVKEKGQEAEVTMITKDYDKATDLEKNTLATFVMMMEDVIRKSKVKQLEQPAGDQR